MIGFRLEPVEPSNKKDDDVGKKKKNKLSVGNFVTNAQGTIIARVVSIDSKSTFAVETNIIVARAISDIGTLKSFSMDEVKRISKKQANKIKKSISKLQETKYKYKDGSKICIGDVVRFQRYSVQAPTSGVIVDCDDSGVPFKIKTIEQMGKTGHSSLTWISLKDITEKIGKYNLKSHMKKAAKAATPRKKRGHCGWACSSREPFRVGIANVYEESQFPQVNKEFLDQIRGPDPEPVAKQADKSGIGVAAVGAIDDYEEYYNEWWQRRQGRFPLV